MSNATPGPSFVAFKDRKTRNTRRGPDTTGAAKLTSEFMTHVLQSLTGTQLKVYLVLLSHFPDVRPSVRRVMKFTGLSRSPIFEALKALKELGLIEEDGTMISGTVVYAIPEWQSPERFMSEVLPRFMKGSETPDAIQESAVAGPMVQTVGEEAKVKSIEESFLGTSGWSGEPDAQGPANETPVVRQDGLGARPESETLSNSNAKAFEMKECEAKPDGGVSISNASAEPRAARRFVPGELPAITTAADHEKYNRSSKACEIASKLMAFGITGNNLQQCIHVCIDKAFTPTQLDNLLHAAKLTFKHNPAGLAYTKIQGDDPDDYNIRLHASIKHPDTSQDFHQALRQLGIEQPSTRNNLVDEFIDEMHFLRNHASWNKPGTVFPAITFLKECLQAGNERGPVDPASEKIGLKVNVIRRNLPIEAEKLRRSLREMGCFVYGTTVHNPQIEAPRLESAASQAEAEITEPFPEDEPDDTNTSDEWAAEDAIDELPPSLLRLARSQLTCPAIARSAEAGTAAIASA